MRAYDITGKRVSLMHMVFADMTPCGGSCASLRKTTKG